MPDADAERFAEFGHLVRAGLAHLYDLSYLETSPLADWLISPDTPRATTRGQLLRDVLFQAIETLLPGALVPRGAREWRGYLVVRHKYVDGMSEKEIGEDMALSARQVQREQQKALQALTRRLWDQRLTHATAPQASPSARNDLMTQELERIDAHPEITDFEESLREAWATVRPLAEAQGSTLTWPVTAQKTRVYADIGLLHQGLVSLFRCALQQDGGALSLSLTVENDQVEMVLASRTNCVQEQVGRLPKPEVESLAIARRLVERNGGHAWLSCEAAEYTWHLTMPVVGPQTVLVIDDNQAAIRLFERYLTSEEFRVVGATDGERALQLATELQPHVITLDLMMPRRDGWQILQAIKENPTVARIPVIICSVLEDHELARTLGAAGCLQKPVSQAALLQALRAIKQRPPSEASLSSPLGSVSNPG